MRRIGPFRHLALRISNVFVYEDGRGRRWLIDSGHRLERPLLLLELRRAGVEPSDLAGVLLTHRHCDHAGNAGFLQRRYGVPVYAHREDAAILCGSRRPVPLARGEGSLIAGVMGLYENRWPASAFVADGDLEEGDCIGGLEVFWIPGHTEGSVFLLHRESGSLVTGDTLINAVPPLTLRRGLSLPYPSFSLDLALAGRSIRAFQERGLAYENLVPGHGPAVVGGARERIDALLAQRPRWAALQPAEPGAG